MQETEQGQRNGCSTCELEDKVFDQDRWEICGQDFHENLQGTADRTGAPPLFPFRRWLNLLYTSSYDPQCEANTMSGEARRHYTLLVTVGSTLFPALTDLILSPPFLDHLSSQAVSRLIVQYGRATIHLPRESGSESSLRSSLDAKGAVTFVWKHISVDIMRFTDDFEGLAKQVDGVISHAGE